MSFKLQIFIIAIVLFSIHSKVMSQNLYSKTFITGSSAKCIESDNSFLYLAGGLSAGLLVKTDLHGNVIFSKNYNTNSSQFSINDIALFNGSIFAVGFTRQFLNPINNYKNYFVAKIDTGNGTIVNSIVGGGFFDDEFTKIVISPSQDIQILGFLNSDPITFGSTNGICIKIDFNLNILTSTKLQISNGNLQLFDVVNIFNESYLVGSSNYMGLDYEDILVCKLDSNMNLIKFKVFDLGYSEIPWSVKYYSNNLFIVGQSNDFIGGSFFGDLFAMKMDTSFNISSCNNINSNSVLGEPSLFIVNSLLYMNSFGQIFRLDSLADVAASINTHIISTDQFVSNTSVYFSREGDFGVLATDTSFISCVNTYPSITQIPFSIRDTVLPLFLTNEPINNIDTIASNNQLTNDILICLLNSNTTAVNETHHISIFPKPANEIITITGLNANGNKQQMMKLNDMTGRTMLTQPLNTDNETQEINISSVSSGSYILSIESDGINVQNKKVVIIK